MITSGFCLTGQRSSKVSWWSLAGLIRGTIINCEKEILYRLDILPDNRSNVTASKPFSHFTLTINSLLCFPELIGSTAVVQPTQKAVTQLPLQEFYREDHGKWFATGRLAEG